MALFGGRNKKNDNTPSAAISYEPAPLFTTRAEGRDSTIAVQSVNDWEGKMYGLDSAAAAIGIDDNFKPSREDVYSIPDVFAEIRAINAALADKSSLLYESALADWRATLTMLLLHQELNIPINELVIDFGELTETDAMFLHTAAEYLPAEYAGRITIYTTKDDLGEDTPFAMSSPYYFVCPAKEIKTKLVLDGEIAEFDGERTVFKDPSAFLKKNPALGYRVTEILTEANDKRIVQGAKTTITDFIRAIGVSRYDDARQAFGTMLISEWKELECAKSSEGIVSAQELFTENICLFQTSEQYGDRGNLNALSYEEVFKDAIADHRVRTKGGDAVFYALLPLRKEFLVENAYYDDGQPDASLFRGLSMESKQEGNSKYIDVSLLYNNVKYTMRYDESKWILPSPKKHSLPPVSVWPNSRDEAKIWKTYYTFIGLRYDENETAHDWSGLSFEVLTKEGAISGHKFTEAHNVAKKQYVDCQYEIIQTDEYPYIFLANSDSGKYYGALASLPGGEGLHIVPDRVAVIGIDFGTSNTVAFYAQKGEDKNGEPIPVDFKNSKVKPAITNYVFDKMSSRFFLSQKELTGDVSFPTILHFSDKRNDKTDLFHGANIYFRGNDRNSGSDVEIMKVPNLETDIKWSNDAQKRIGALKFLTELAVFCAWQTVSKTQAGKLEWRFSFPSSISNPEEFTGALRTAAESAAHFVFGERVIEKPKIDITSESHAAGLYFLNQKNPIVNQDKGFVSIDIGGGSTDISIWQKVKEKAKAEASVKFAGRDILTGNALSLCEDHEMSQLWMQMGIDQRVISNVVSAWEGADIEPALRFETMLAIAGSGLNSALRINNAQKPLSNMIKIISFNLSMLTALAAAMLRELVVNDIFELANELVVMFCGNGSRIRSWLPSDNDVFLSKVFKIIVGGDLVDARIRFEQSERPKVVVAAGLVSVNRLRGEAETFNAADYKDDMLDQKTIISNSGEKSPGVVEEVVYLFGSLYDILLAEDTGFQLNKYASFRDKESYIEKLRAGVSALDPVSTGLRKITYANAFVKCAEISNHLLITDMRNQ
jgi:hypothetical protein